MAGEYMTVVVPELGRVRINVRDCAASIGEHDRASLRCGVDIEMTIIEKVANDKGGKVGREIARTFGASRKPISRG